MPQIGEKVYFFSGGPYVQQGTILGHTSRSWLIGDSSAWWAGDAERIKQYARKVPKNGVCFVSQEEGELHAWAINNRYSISHAVQFVTDGKVLKQIADLIGYTEPGQQGEKVRG